VCAGWFQGAKPAASKLRWKLAADQAEKTPLTTVASRCPNVPPAITLAC